MTEPEAGPVATTKEGSDCDNPANSPLLFFFFFFAVIYHGRNLLSLFISIDLEVENNLLLQLSTIYVLPEMLDECLTKHHLVPQPQLFEIFFLS